MSKYVYVLTRPDMGWDCVLGVFRDKDNAYEYALEEDYSTEIDNRKLDLMLNDRGYVLHSEKLI